MNSKTKDFFTKNKDLIFQPNILERQGWTVHIVRGIKKIAEDIDILIPSKLREKYKTDCIRIVFPDETDYREYLALHKVKSFEIRDVYIRIIFEEPVFEYTVEEELVDEYDRVYQNCTSTNCLDILVHEDLDMLVFIPNFRGEYLHFRRIP